MTHINSRIAAWMAVYNQRDLVAQFVTDGHTMSPVYEKEKKRLNDLEAKAKNHKP